MSLTPTVALWLVIAHAVGDYLFQSHWMATEKTKRWWPALAHAVTYGLPFIPLVPDVWAWLIIVGSHAVIDRYRLARYVVWAKNQIGPPAYRPALSSPTGYPADTPTWLAVWLLIIADNTLQVIINLFAVGHV